MAKPVTKRNNILFPGGLLIECPGYEIRDVNVKTDGIIIRIGGYAGKRSPVPSNKTAESIAEEIKEESLMEGLGQCSVSTLTRPEVRLRKPKIQSFPGGRDNLAIFIEALKKYRPVTPGAVHDFLNISSEGAKGGPLVRRIAGFLHKYGPLWKFNPQRGDSVIDSESCVSGDWKISIYEFQRELSRFHQLELIAANLEEGPGESIPSQFLELAERQGAVFTETDPDFVVRSISSCLEVGARVRLDIRDGVMRPILRCADLLTALYACYYASIGEGNRVRVCRRLDCGRPINGKGQKRYCCKGCGANVRMQRMRMRDKKAAMPRRRGFLSTT